MFRGFSPASINLPNSLIKKGDKSSFFVAKFIMYLMFSITIIYIIAQIVLPMIFPEYGKFIQDLNR